MGRSLSTPELNAGVSSIATATGFTAGDYVYQMRGGTGSVPDGALSTGAFAYNSIPSSILPMSTNSTADLTYPEINGGTSGGQVAAKLNNGNIVFVYARGAVGTYVQTAYFKIVDAAGATVVAETAVSGATVGGRYSVSVCVLPNNNFTVVWSNQNAGSNTNWNISFRIYQQDGTAVTAATTNTTLTLSSATTNGGSLLKVIARSDNSFIIMAYNGYNTSFVAASSAGFSTAFNGGTGVYNRTVSSEPKQYIDYAVRGDDTIHIFYSTSGTSVLYDVLNSSGTATTSGAVLGVFPRIYCISCARMPNGNVNVFLYVGETATNNSILAYSWSGSTLSYIGRPVQFSTSNAPDYIFLASYPQGASNGFTLFYANPDTSGALTYQSFNSSGVPVSGSVARTIPAISYPIGCMMQASIFDVGSSTRFYMNQRANIASASSSNMTGSYRGVYYFSYNATSYNLNRVSTASASFGNIGSIPLNAYSRASSTPVEAAFSVAATGDYTSQVPAGTNLVNKVVVSSVAARNISAIQLSNGNNVIAYITGNSLILKSYNISGLEVASTVASTSVVSGGSCTMAPFSNNTFIIFYRDGAVTTTLRYIIFDASFTSLFSGTISTTVQSASQVQYRIAACAYGDGSQVAVAYALSTTNNYLEVKNISSANVVSTIFTASADPFSQPNSMYMIPYRGDAFTLIYREGGTASAYITGVTFWKTGATTWTRGNNNTFYTSLEANPLNVFVYPAPAPHSNSIGLVQNYAETTPYFFYGEPVWNAGGSFDQGNTPNITGFSLDGNNFSHAIGMTGNGGLVWATQRLSTTGNFLSYASLRPAYQGGSNSIGTVVNSGYATSGSGAANYGDLQISPHVEGACLIAFLDNNNYPSFFVPMVYPSQVSTTLTAGTDISTTKLALNPENGYILRGVALTTATAGNTGLVQTKGVATVSNSYSSAASAIGFDSRNPITTTGVRGSVLGRTVTLEA